MRKPAEFEAHPVGYETARDEGITRGVVKWVQDGDTVGLLIDAGHYLYGIIELRLTVSALPPLDYFNTPEIVGTEHARGVLARDALASFALNQHVVHQAKLTRTGREDKTFERFIGPCWLVDGLGERHDIALWMRQQGFDKLHPLDSEGGG